MDLFLSLLFRINQDIRDRNLLQSHERVLLSVSGGQDSICLILFFISLRHYWMWDLGLIHCEHGWRKDARKNASQIIRIAEDYKIPYFQILPTTILRSEEHARNWRYSKIIEIASAHNYTNLVTGHTATDRAETMFMNLTRGSGCSGLHSLQWKRCILTQDLKKIHLIRPLLGLQREELKIIVTEFKLALWPDTTNQEMKLTRNRIRKQLLPYLRFLLNRNLDKSFAQFAELNYAETIFLESLTKKVLAKIEINSTALDITNFQLIPIALQRRVIRMFLQKNRKKIVTFEETEKIRYICLNPTIMKTFSFKMNGLVFIQEEKLMFRQLD